ATCVVPTYVCLVLYATATTDIYTLSLHDALPILRPARYIVTDDDRVILASEAGVLPVAEEHVVTKWRLQPGRMLLIDLEKGRIVDRKSTRLNSSHVKISYAVFCLKKKKHKQHAHA